MPNKAQSLEGRMFAVAAEPYCAWWLKDTNSTFLRGIDTSYFRYLAEVHSKALDGEDKQRAAVALRTSYYHGLETLFMLIFAAVQAPKAVVGWLLKCRSVQLRKLVMETTSGKLRPISTMWKLEEASWPRVSKLVNGRIFAGQEECEAMQRAFAQLWERFANDFTEECVVDEYNSFKHGFRAHVGGGPSMVATPPKGASAEPFKIASDFGSTFFVPRELESPRPGFKHLFRIAYCHVNIQPTAMVSALSMISISINNVVAFLRLANGHLAEGLEIRKPTKMEAFDPAAEPLGGLVAVTLKPNVTIPDNEFPQLTKDRILERLVLLC